MAENNQDNNIIGRLIKTKREGKFDPNNPEHTALLSQLLMTLNYCTDTITQIHEWTGTTSPSNHAKTYDDVAGPGNRH